MSSELVMAGVGEVLVDLFEGGVGHLGGAPCNVVFYFHQLLKTLNVSNAAMMVSAAGKDHWGEFIRSSLVKASMCLDYIAVDADHPSGTATVNSSQGKVGYDIQDAVAWDYLRWTPETESLAKRCSAVSFGSLAQRSPTSRGTIQRFVSEVKGPRLYDVNLRRNITDGVAGYSEKIIADSCALATIVKLNHDELEQVSKLLGFSVADHEVDKEAWRMMERILKEYSLMAVVVTRDAKGAWLLSHDRCLTLPDSRLPKEWIHPVGAGDAFSAGLLVGVLLDWPLEFSLELADLIASLVVTELSATPSLSEDISRQVIAQAAKARHSKPMLVQEAVR